MISTQASHADLLDADGLSCRLRFRFFGGLLLLPLLDEPVAGSLRFVQRRVRMFCVTHAHEVLQPRNIAAGLIRYGHFKDLRPSRERLIGNITAIGLWLLRLLGCASIFRRASLGGRSDPATAAPHRSHLRILPSDCRWTAAANPAVATECFCRAGRPGCFRR
jgi:hypothetical protein